MAWEHLGHWAGITGTVESLNAEGNKEWVDPGELWLPESLSLKHRIIHLATQLLHLFHLHLFCLPNQTEGSTTRNPFLPPTHAWS